LKIEKPFFNGMVVLSIEDDVTSLATLGIATAWQRHSSLHVPGASWSLSFSQFEMDVLDSSRSSTVIVTEAVDWFAGGAAFVPTSHNAGQKSSIATRPSQRTATRFLTIFLRISFSMPCIYSAGTILGSNL
jgi:hypothetical protein